METGARAQTYRRLERRNSVVGALRFLVPLGGAAVLAGLGTQIYLASFTGRFGVERISIGPDAVTIEAPEYSGILEDGSSYRVTAETAQAAMGNTDLIDLTNARVVLNRLDGVQMQADAAIADLDMKAQTVFVEGVMEVATSEGTTGTLVNSTFDWQRQVLTTNGAVAIDYADGTSVEAEGLVYDAGAVVWTFTRSVVTLPQTPGEDGDSSPDGD